MYFTQLLCAVNAYLHGGRPVCARHAASLGRHIALLQECNLMQQPSDSMAQVEHCQVLAPLQSVSDVELCKASFTSSSLLWMIAWLSNSAWTGLADRALHAQATFQVKCTTASNVWRLLTSKDCLQIGFLLSVPTYHVHFS